jgi:hypothetical protein
MSANTDPAKDIRSDGGPAFPCPVGHIECAHPEGLSKRELLAALAMAGDFASQTSDMGVIANDMTEEQIENRVDIYFRFAEAIIRQ